MLMGFYKVKVLLTINIVKSIVKIKTDLTAMKKRFKKTRLHLKDSQPANSGMIDIFFVAASVSQNFCSTS